MIADVLASGARPKRPSALSASMTFFWRALLKIKHVPEQLFDVFAFPIIGLLMFTYLFGGALAGSTGDYLQYVLPGILVQTVVMITMYTGVGLNTDVTKGVFDRFRSLPIWRPATLVGMLLGDVVRYTIAGSMIVLVGLILGFRPDGGVPGVLAGLGLVLIFSFSMAWVWTLVGLVAKTPQSVMGIEHDGPLPADLHLQRLRRPGDDAVLAARVRRGQPDHAARQRRPRLHGGQPRRRRHRPVADVQRPAGRDLRPTDDAPLQRRTLTHECRGLGRHLELLVGRDDEHGDRARRRAR